VIIIVAGLLAVVGLVAYKYWALGDRGAEFDLVVKRSESLGDPQDPHCLIELKLDPGPSPAERSAPSPDRDS